MDINNIIEDMYFLFEQIKRDIESDRNILLLKSVGQPNPSSFILLMKEAIDSTESTLESNLQSCRELKEELQKFI